MAKAGLGFWMCLSLVVGNMIASGIFLLPSSLAPYGMNSVFGWLFTSAGSFLLALIFASLVKVIPHAGGPYVYPQRAFGEGVGFVVAWGYWMAVCVGNAAIATGTVSYLIELIPILKKTQAAPAVTTCVMIWILTYINWRGVRTVGFFQAITTLLKLVPLLVIGGLGVWLLCGRHFELIKIDPQPFTFNAITASATLTLWAFLGLESATIPADNVRDPERNIPRATLWGMAIAAVIYLIVCTTVMLLIPKEELAVANAPFALVARQFWGENAARLVALFAFISGFGALNGWIFIQGKMPAVLAEAGVFPKIFARQSKHQTPGTSLVLTSLFVTILVILNYNSSMVNIFTFLLLVSTSACLFMYLFCALAVLKLTLQGEMGVVKFRFFGLIIVSILASIYSCWSLYGAGSQAFWLGTLLLAAGIPVYAGIKWNQRKQKARLLKSS